MSDQLLSQQQYFTPQPLRRKPAQEPLRPQQTPDPTNSHPSSPSEKAHPRSNTLPLQPLRYHTSQITPHHPPNANTTPLPISPSPLIRLNLPHTISALATVPNTRLLYIIQCYHTSIQNSVSDPYDELLVRDENITTLGAEDETLRAEIRGLKIALGAMRGAMVRVVGKGKSGGGAGDGDGTGDGDKMEGVEKTGPGNGEKGAEHREKPDLAKVEEPQTWKLGRWENVRLEAGSGWI